MGNNKSSLHGMNEFNEDEDDARYGFHKRGTSVRQLRGKRNHELVQHAVTDNLKRTNSLPMKVAPPKIRKGQSKLVPTDSNHDPQVSSSTEMIVRPLPVQGFDLIRHHLGQSNAEDSRLAELETNIQLLNEKLADVEICRRECLQKLRDLRQNPPEKAQQPASRSHSMFGRKKSSTTDDAPIDMRLPLTIIDAYLKRVTNLLATDKEPLLLDQLEIEHKLKQKNRKHELNFLSNQKNKSKSTISLVDPASSSHALKDKYLSQENINSANQGGTPLEKCQQIKQAYSQLIRSILPKLYGRHFDHRNDADFRDYRHRLEALAERVKRIQIGEEQCLLDAHKLFLMELDGYLHILDDMVRCPIKQCSTCNQTL